MRGGGVSRGSGGGAVPVLPAGADECDRDQAGDPVVSDGWLCEDQALGVRLCLKVKERLDEGRTAHQRIEIAVTERLGRVLALDGRFMLSERDEAFYHEMLVHPALISHEAPRRILVVGGGDGGALRQVLAHPSVEEAILVEIDPGV
ncbi:MAG TPA: hypothetical protein ENN53_02400, partial [Candidatus Acetothermia bacterium]|nr:hypothetical protein [Candidatus Acetothermia bacterium]